MNTTRNIILFLPAILYFVIFTNDTLAVWSPPLASPPWRGVWPALNISVVSQEKIGGLTVKNIKIRQNGFFSRIGVGTASADKALGINASGDIKADKFCLGVRPAVEGCISNWSEGFGLSGGQAGALFRWVSGSSMGPSSISESGDSVTVAVGKKVSASGDVTIDNGAKPESGLKISQLAGVSTIGLPGSNKMLSIDSATGEVILVNANCAP